MKYRFMAEHFYYLTDIQDSPLTEPQRCILTKLQAQAIATEANALLEKWEAESDRVYYCLWSGRPGRLTTVEKPDDLIKAILWNPKEIKNG